MTSPWRFGTMALTLLACVACSAVEVVPAPGPGGAGGGAGGWPSGGNGGAAGCSCVPGPHNDLIYTLSDDGEIWSFDPQTAEFAYVRTLLCPGAEDPFSLAVDHQGHAWVLSAETKLIFDLDLTSNQGCSTAPYIPYQAGFDLFGMAFSAAAVPGDCPQLYAHSYSGNGPFTEGPDSGTLAVIDPTSGALTELGAIDYDGGELAGTGNGRLFAFAGEPPAKLVEYDKASGAVLSTLVLDGLRKTNASAFAFFAGDAYFFTEAVPAGCYPCLTSECGSSFQACLDDPLCVEQLHCAIDLGDISDACGGALPAAMANCLMLTCGTECMLPSYLKVSQVTKLDYHNSQQLSVPVEQAPIRIVGAGDAVCVPYLPR